jgi:hypothetical protein
MPALGINSRSIKREGVRRRGSKEGFGRGVWRRGLEKERKIIRQSDASSWY